MNEFSKRLVELADHFRVSKPADFAKRVGITHPAATNYLKGKRLPTLDILLKIQNSFEGLNIDWLLSARGNMLLGEPQPQVYNQESKQLEVKDLEIDYLKRSNKDKDDVIQSQKTLIQVLSEKTGTDVSDLSPGAGTVKVKKSRIKGFGSSYGHYFQMLIPNFELRKQ